MKELQAEGFASVGYDRYTMAPGDRLGHVILCAGVGYDFKERPYDAIRAHVTLPAQILESADFESFLYLSSTRLYRHSANANEKEAIEVSTFKQNDLYTASKLAGEAIVLAADNPAARVVRLSNVYGDDFDSKLFLSTVIRLAIDTNEILFTSSPSSAKDFIFVDDAMKALIAVALRGRHRLYNVAAGMNVTNAQVGALLRAITGCRISYIENPPEVVFPSIDVRRFDEEFRIPRASLSSMMEAIVDLYKTALA